MKILFLIGTLGVGGAEKVLIDLVNNLDPQKYQITVQTLIDIGEKRAALSPNIRYRSIVRFKSGFLRDIATKILLKILPARFIYRAFVKDGYDCEIAFLEGFPTKILAYSDDPKGKTYAWVHTDLNAFPDSYRAYGSEEKEGRAYRKFDRIFCVSEGVKTAIQKKYALDDATLDVVYNIMDDKAVYDGIKETSDFLPAIRPYFISVGRLIEQKGYERLLRVHRRLIGEGLFHTLAIIGDGPLKETLVDYIEKNSLSETAFLLGYQSNPHKYVKDADLFVCSSLAEGYSTAVGEAVLSGTPVLSTDVAGAREPFRSPRCSIVIDNDEEALYDALRALLQNPKELVALRSGLEARQEGLRKDFLLAEFEKKVLMTVN